MSYSVVSAVVISPPLAMLSETNEGASLSKITSANNINEDGPRCDVPKASSFSRRERTPWTIGEIMSLKIGIAIVRNYILIFSMG